MQNQIIANQSIHSHGPALKLSWIVPVLPALLALAGVLALAGCDATTTPPDGPCPIFRHAASTQILESKAESAEAGEWVDLGLISQTESVRGLVVVDGDILVATDDGVWRRPVTGDAAWVRSGLEGRDVLSLTAIEGTATVLAGTAAIPEEEGAGTSGDEEAGTLFRSEDRGETWEVAAEGLYDPEFDMYDPVEYLAVEPGTTNPRLFAGLSGSTIAHSDDGGETWRVIRGSLGGFGYACPIHVAESDRSTLFQGCEAPLDFAWIRSFDISASELHDLGEGCEIVGIDQISNRRPNVLTSFEHAPGRLYAGLEGALIVIDADGWDWIWVTDGNEGEEYTYVKFVWVDPADPDHIVFGGGDGPPGEDTRAGLFETFDGGETVDQIDTPEGIDFAVGGVRAGAPVDEGRDFVIAHLIEEGARVLMRRHE